jgi:hypothetical protein
MAKRVCLTCPAIIPAGTRGGRCTTCNRAQDKARGTRQARGYGVEHQRLRADWQKRIDAGEHVTCWRPECGATITGTAWHLGHDDLDRSITRGPECIACNLSAAGKHNTLRYL